MLNKKLYLVTLFLCLWITSQGWADEQSFVGIGFFSQGKSGVVYSYINQKDSKDRSQNIYIPQVGDTLISIIQKDAYHLWKVTSVKKNNKNERDLFYLSSAYEYQIDCRFIKKVEVEKNHMMELKTEFQSDTLGPGYMTFLFKPGNPVTNNTQQIISQLPKKTYNYRKTDLVKKTAIYGNWPENLKGQKYRLDIWDSLQIGDETYLFILYKSEPYYSNELVLIKNGIMTLVWEFPIA